MRLVSCTEERHGTAILAIFNEAIVNSTAIYDYEPRAPETMAPWFAIKRNGGLPILGVEDTGGNLRGFASYGTFRAWPAYKYTVEHSIYIEAGHRGAGLGRRLLEALIARAVQLGVHTMVGAIDVNNASSIALHRHLGFEHAGTIRHAAFKFSRWLDLAFYQLILDTPTH